MNALTGTQILKTVGLPDAGHIHKINIPCRINTFQATVYASFCSELSDRSDTGSIKNSAFCPCVMSLTTAWVMAIFVCITEH